METFQDFLDTIPDDHPVKKESAVFKHCCEMLDYEVDSFWLRTHLTTISKLRSEIEEIELKTEDEKEICTAFIEMLKAHHQMWSAIYKRDYGEFSNVYRKPI